MPTLIWSKVKDGLDPAMKKKAYAFLEKLQASDQSVGLHIEPITNSVDKRVRTGRVDDNFRCVLFKIAADPEPVYVIHGIWPHDKANAIAERVRLSMNPINGMPQVERVMDELRAAASTPSTAAVIAPPAAAHQTGAPSPSPHSSSLQPLAQLVPDNPAPVPPHWGPDVTVQRLVDDLGIDATLAAQALAAETDTDLMDLIAGARIEWQGDVLLDLATGSTVDTVRSAYHLDAAREALAGDASDDEKLLAGLRTPAAASGFHWIEDDTELRRIIEAGDLGAWRLFLHPDQRTYVDKDHAGPARLSGGAGTGKTVVTVHRAHRLAVADPTARILLTTFTRNLADDLETSLRRLDDTTPLVTRLDTPGIYTKGIDALAWAIVQRAAESVQSAVTAVLGAPRPGVLRGTDPALWQQAISAAGADLPDELRSPAFFEAEYQLVILPAAITTETAYLRVRRTGRGVALDRTKRLAVWQVVEAYRAKARAADSTDFQEKAAIAARWLRDTGTHLFDHVLVDEAQDLTPLHLLLLRAVVAPARNDLFLSEDSHQRIYGHKVTLSHYGITVRGRSRRLTLNYRTTAQNLAWAMRVLDGGHYTDLEGEADEHRYHSARSGPRPLVLPVTGLADQLATAARLIRSWLPADGDPTGRAPHPEAIAVLVRDRYRRDTVVNGLAEHGLEVRAVDREAVRPGRPLVMTMHRAKGLEFTHVLLFGVDEGPTAATLRGHATSELDYADALLRDRSLVYVAATRARDVLAVLTTS